MTTPGAPEPVGAADGQPWSENDLTAIRAFVATAVVDGDFLFQGDPLFVTKRWMATLAAAQARSPAGDALLDYRDPPSSERADRLVQAEARVARLAESLGILVRACKAGAYTGRLSDAVVQADQALAPDGAGT